MPPCAQVRLPACGRDVHAEQLPQRHGKGGMTDPSAVSCALSRTAARLLARLICTRPDPIARARSLPSTRVRPDARRRPVFKMTGVPKRPGPSSTANRRALRPPAARLLAPSRPQRPPARPSARPRPLLPHAQPSDSSQILAFTSLPHLPPLAPRSSGSSGSSAPPGSSGSSGSSLSSSSSTVLCCSVGCVRAFMGRAWVGPPLLVLRSR